MAHNKTHAKQTFNHGWLATIFVFAVSYTSAIAVAKGPVQVLEQASNEMIAALNNNREAIKLDPSLTQTLVEDILLPHIDIVSTSRAVMGKYWDQASKDQKITFIKSFKTLLLRFYSSALSEYLNTHDEVLDENIMTFYMPGELGDQKNVVVRSEVQVKNEKSVPILYHMHKTKKGWRVYDVTVEGVSLVTTYRTSFGSEIEAGGIDAMLESLAERNEKLEAGDNSALSSK